MYDAAGNMLATIHPLGNRATFAYDALNRRIASTDARAGVTTYVYNATGDLVNIIDPVNNKTTFVYDACTAKPRKLTRSATAPRLLTAPVDIPAQ